MVLSIWKLRVGVENYYLAQVARGLDEYYTGRGEVGGRWVGAASSGLGLDGPTVTPEDLRAVLAGLCPGTGQSPNGGPPRAWKGRVPGFDLTFSAPKSVSIVYALGDPSVSSAVVDAIDTATEHAVAWLEREACFARRGSNNRAGVEDGFGTRRVRGAGFVAAAFRHRTSRAGDPQLHTHVLVANMSRGLDGRWTALDGQALYRSAHAAGAVFRAVLQAELTARLGVAWRPGRSGLGEVAGVPERVVRLFSKRRGDIEAALEAAGVEGAKRAEAAALATRTPKQDDGFGLRERWLSEAATVHFGPTDVAALVASTPLVPGALRFELVDSETGMSRLGEVSSGEFASAVAERMAQVDATCSRHQILQIVADMLPAGATAAALDEVTSWVLATPELIPIPTPDAADAGWEDRWTSRRLAEVEADILAVIDRRGDQPAVAAAVVDEVLADLTLGADQAAAVRSVTGATSMVGVVVGRAGTGKTYTMRAVRDVYAAVGRRLIGVAPSARAARELGDGAGIDAYTLPRFARHALPHLTPSDVVVVDEAAMAGTLELHRLLSATAAVGASVILVGDHHQLPEITAGGVFAATVAQRGRSAAELTVNRRQHAAWEQTALDHLRHGRALEGFTAYQDHDRVHLTATTTESHTAAVTAWLDAHRQGRDAIILAATRAETRALNALARTAASDELSGPVLNICDGDFQVGDRVVLLRNDGNQHDLDTGQRCRVDNGMVATITTIHPDTDTVDITLTNGRHIRLDHQYLHAGWVDHGYATTVHKAQGITCDEVFLVGPDGLYREAVYVAMSRARHGAHLFATSRQVAELTEQAHHAGIPLPSEHPDDVDHDLRHAVQTSRAKQLAHTHEPHLLAISRMAARVPLDVLWARHVEIRAVVRQLLADGHIDAATAVDQAARARTHRQYMHPGGRVHAADWDNIGTIVAIDDRHGAASITFTSTNGTTATRILPWHQLQPVDHPDPVELTDTAAAFLDALDDQAALDTERWRHLLDEHGIGPDEPHTVPAAIAMRRRQLAHRLAGNPPDWLTWWYGSRPTDPAGAQVWDDEIDQLAAWRDARQLDDHTPGYGPPPTRPHHRARWETHLDRSLTTRNWLHHHNPQLDQPTPANHDIVAVRARLDELDVILKTAPPDQQRIIADLHHGHLSPADIHQALVDAAATQHERRQWILEHWPHVVEHAELTRIRLAHDALAHWPRPIPHDIASLLDDLAAYSTDTPEMATIGDIDRQLDDAEPNRHLDDLRHQHRQLVDQVAELAMGAADGEPARDELADHHRRRLTEHTAAIAADIERLEQRLTFDTSIWGSGARPHHLTETLQRRANHLAHHAIVNREQWVIAAATAWHTHQPHSTLDDLHQLVADIATHRERTHHSGSEPLPPTATDGHDAAERERLQHLLGPAPSISDLVNR